MKIADKIDYDDSKFNKKMSRQGVIARTIILDRETQKFIDANPDAVCICIGSGFDTRYQRLKHGKITWYNLDFPDVINLRKQLLVEGDNVKYIGKSALDSEWPCEVNIEDRPVLIILEGILMYFTEVEVIELFSIIKAHFSGCTILAEIMHPMIAKQTKHHDTVKNTTAKFSWGIKGGKNMVHLCDKLVFEQEWNLMEELTDQGLYFYIIGRLKFISNKLNKIVKLKMC